MELQRTLLDQKTASPAARVARQLSSKANIQEVLVGQGRVCTGMKVVGLLSGGKDSVFNLLHCVLNGHEPVALASLGPPQGKDELDSYMYQTVGHSGLTFISQAMGLPLITGVIQGSAVAMGGEYGDRAAGMKGQAGDETEDLYKLLQTVKARFPDVQGVSVGAILSNYQRVRVEHVCTRLGLTSLAYLWERDQRALLSEMVQAGMESVLVKVAGAGLGVEHLGKSLLQMEPTLHRLNDKYQLHICGEGGEYETFTLDCPLYSRRLILDHTTTILSNPDPYSTVAHLHLDALSLADKVGFVQDESFETKRARVRQVLQPPPILDEIGVTVREEVARGYASVAELAQTQDVAEAQTVREPPPEASISEDGGWVAFANVSSLDDSLSLADEVHAAFLRLSELLATASATVLHLSHLTVYLSPESMPLFPAINALYATYFGTSPPTRACVAVRRLGGNRRLVLEGWARKGETSGRTSLHVQSLSYWASANIGPYSQAISCDDRLFVAGQIGLVPASLTIPPSPSYADEAALSLQHLRRIVAAVESGRWRGTAEGGVCWLTTGNKGTQEWRRRVAGARAAAREAAVGPILFVEAASLPRGAGIEWQITFSRMEEAVDSDDDDDSTTNSTSRRRRPVGILGFSAGKPPLIKVVSNPLLVRAFHLPSVKGTEVKELALEVFGRPLPPLTAVEAGHLATMEEDQVDVGIIYG